MRRQPPNVKLYKSLFICLTILLSVCARAEDVYQIHRLSESELLKTYTSIMRDACHHADQFWHQWPSDPRAGFWGSGRTENMNEGIRAISGMALTSAALVRYADGLKEDERAECLRKALASFRFVTATHVTGTGKCMDGKSWGDSWQSAMWAGDVAFAAWLIWDDVDADLRKDIERVLGHEADRFLEGKPPAGSFNDTKAEENGWDLICIAVAANMFPNNPHAAAWREKALEYMMNTLSAPQDKDSDTLVDGRRVSEWFVGANLHPDFTLENHGFFHPGYVGCSSYFMTETEMFFTFAHQPVPEAASHHLMDTWRMFQGILLPNGESACPQGMDWELHGLPYINLFASLACHQKDAMAAYLENKYIQYARAWQLMRAGDMAAPGSRLGFERHAICALQTTYGFLAHKIFGPPVKALTPREAASAVECTQTHDWIQVVTHRTEDKFVSFSWTNRIMGMLMPIGPEHESNPDFTVPLVGGFVGSFELVPRAKGKGKGDAKPTVAEHAWRKTPDGFETTGTLLLDGGRLKQTLRMISVGEKAVVYEDRVTAVKDVTVAEERGLPLGIENDEITGGKRLVSFKDGKMVFDERSPQHPFSVPGSWVNVDGRLGVVIVTGSGMNYAQAPGYAPGISVCTDVLYGSFSNQARHFKAGEEVARRVAILMVETTPKETAAIAKSARIDGPPRNQTLHFKADKLDETELLLE